MDKKREVVEARLQNKFPTLPLRTREPAAGTARRGTIHLVNRDNTHWYTYERAGAPSLTVEELTAAATAALKAALADADAFYGAAGVEERAQLEEMVDECVGHSDYEGVQEEVGAELRALKARMDATLPPPVVTEDESMGVRPVSRDTGGASALVQSSIKAFVSGVKRDAPHDDTRPPAPAAKRAALETETPSKPTSSPHTPSVPTANMLKKNRSPTTAAEQVEQRNAAANRRQWRVTKEYPSIKQVLCTICNKYISANKEGLDSHELSHKTEEKTLDQHYKRAGLPADMTPAQARKLLTAKLVAKGVSYNVIGTLVEDVDLLKLAAASAQRPCSCSGCQRRPPWWSASSPSRTTSRSTTASWRAARTCSA